MIIYNGKNSELDFDLYVASKELPSAERKVIEETVPYMSGLWDFSYHDGDVDEYEPVVIKYTFDVFADTKQELTKIRDTLVNWIHRKGDGKLYDTDISLNEYYEVYRAKAVWTEDEKQGLLTVEFTCYPFRKSEDKIVYKELSATKQTITVENTGFRKIVPTITVYGSPATISDGTNTRTLGSGVHNDVFTLDVGKNVFEVTGGGAIRFVYQTEVL